MLRERERLRKGDSEMTAEELQATIERAQTRYRELEEQQPAAQQTAKVLSILSRAAELYRAPDFVLIRTMPGRRSG